jgi:glycosyltransferase involved in cell wall biosynthesis
LSGSPASRTRIVRLITRLNVGGPAQHVVWLAEALNDEEFETILITGTVPSGENDMAGFAAAHGVHPVVVPQMSREISPSDVVTVWKVYRLLRALKPDIVHTHTAKAGMAGRVAGWLYRYLTPGTLVGRPRRCGLIHTYHGHVFHGYYGALKSRVILAIERALARFATDRIIVLSEQQLHEIRDRFRVGRGEQFRIVPLGIDIEAVRGDEALGSLVRQGLGVSETSTLVGIVGRLTPIKNHELFMRVAARFIAAPRFTDVCFVIFGDGAERGALERRALELAPGGRILFAGMQPPAAIFAAVDIAALTSLNEGTPLALIEAMANGTPIVSTAVGGVVDLLGAVVERVSDPAASYDVRERGITAASGDEAGLAAGLERLLRDEELERRFASAGREFVEMNRSRQRLVADIIGLTRELTS